MTGAQAVNGRSRLDRLLERLLAAAPGARHVLVLSGDGLKLCWSPGLDLDQADRLAAIVSGVLSLSLSAAAEFGDGIGSGQAMVEFRGGILLMVPAGNRAHLAVLAAPAADVGLVGQVMNEAAGQVGELLGTPLRRPGPRPGHAP
jgi:predicted regulator of Ras-like GTPase activity (Roadblock/LC7/MglB family)